MVKPQFEVGRERLGSGGVVRDPALRADAVLGGRRVPARRAGWHRAGVARSPLPGPSGNVEFFLWLRRMPAEPGWISSDQIRQPSRRATGEEAT